MAASYTVTRTRVVQAPPGEVYPLVADFPCWVRWSPWEGAGPLLDVERFVGRDFDKGLDRLAMAVRDR